MPIVSYKGHIIAQSDDVQLVEGNFYFPPESVNADYLADSDHSTVCPWKGTASYYHLTVDGETITNAAWYYPEAKPNAKPFENYIAFYGSKVDIGR